jgi:hypothetical protein
MYYNNVYHLNNVNNLHSQIKEMNARYRVVATKYLNRYLALLTFVQEIKGIDCQEELFYFLKTMKFLKFSISNKLVEQYHLLNI